MNKQEETYFAALSKDRSEIADVLERRAVRGYKDSVVEKYSDQAHFIYELLQNTDDACATRARFILEENRLVFAHNGSRHFSVSNPANEDVDSENIHKFSVYSKFLYTMLPKGQGGEKVNIDDKVLLEYYKLEKDFEGAIELESADGGYVPISGEAGRREPKKDPLTIIIDKINERFGTQFTEMDKVLVQMENDYAKQEKWQSYAKNNDRSTFMLLFEKDFPTMAAERYEQNDEFFRRLFGDPDMMKQVMDTVGAVLYERLKKQFIYDPKSGVIDEATPETYVEDTYVKFD